MCESEPRSGATPRLTRSVRRASDFVQQAIALKMQVRTASSAKNLAKEGIVFSLSSLKPRSSSSQTRVSYKSQIDGTAPASDIDHAIEVGTLHGTRWPALQFFDEASRDQKRASQSLPDSALRSPNPQPRILGKPTTALCAVPLSLPEVARPSTGPRSISSTEACGKLLP